MTNLKYVTIILIAPLILFGQYEYSIKNHALEARFNGVLFSTNEFYNSSISSLHSTKLDSVKDRFNKEMRFNRSSWLGRKAFNESLVKIISDSYELTINPVVNFQLGFDEETKTEKYVNSRGFLLQGKIGDKLSFYSSFIENQAILPDYINSFIDERGVVPGQGFSRDFGENGRDYSIAGGEVSYSPNQTFSFTLGQGTNFFGEGYRSMLLSDASYNYPFFRIQTEFWKVKYVNLWGQLFDVRDSASTSSGVLAKKYLSSHYLSFDITPRWNFSLFEAIILGDVNQLRGPDVSFFNPVIFYRPVEFGVGSQSGNALLGAASSYKIISGLQIYSQFVLDEFTSSEFFSDSGYWANKYGFQLGLKFYNAFNVKGLFARLEFNRATHYTYSHKIILNNYASYGQPLAHPWGANFNEGLLHINYFRNRWEFEARFQFGKIGLDTASSNWGSDIYKSYNTRESDFGNVTGQGVNGTLTFLFLKAGWLVNPESRLKVEAGLQFRSLKTNEKATSPVSDGRSNYFFFGLKTDLYNQYYDF